MIRSVNAAHLHSQSPSCFWLAVEAPSLSPLSLPPSSSSLLILLHTSSGTALPMLPACECACFWPWLLAQAPPFFAARSGWEQISVDGETRALPGATHSRCSPTVSCAPLRLSDTCRWDLDLTMVPFLLTCFEIPGGANRGNLRTSLLGF